MKDTAPTDEGADIPLCYGLLTPGHLEMVNKHQLVEGKQYVCDHCGRTYTAPFVYRCVCGCKCCKNCESDHVNGG
jgi:hypothetical protein